MRCVLSVLLAAYSLILVHSAMAEPPGAPGAPADAEALARQTAAKQLAAGQLAAPSEHHERLAPLAGKWKLAVKWRAADGDPWTESQGTAEYQWILGRRFLQESFQYDMSGQTLQWLGVYGFDNYQKQYTAVWFDNMGTNTEFATTQYDARAKAFTFLGEQDDPPTGGKRKFKWIITLESADRVRFESYDQSPPGRFFKNTEVTATRVTNDK